MQNHTNQYVEQPIMATMHPSAVLLMILGIAAAVRAGAGAGGRASILGTPEARFWEEALPGILMPEAIADMIQKGIWY
jgi:hypothetical protein